MHIMKKIFSFAALLLVSAMSITAVAEVTKVAPFERLNTTNDLKSGDTIVFVSESAAAVSGALYSTYLPAITENVKIDKSTGKADVPETAQTFVLSKYGSNWQLIATGTTDKLLLDVTGKGAFSYGEPVANQKLANWGITISNGVADVSRPGEGTFPVEFNSDRFKPYKSVGSGTAIALYKKVGAAEELQSKLEIGAINFGEVEQDEAKVVQVNYTAENLTDDIIWEVEGTDAALFDVSDQGNRTSGTVTVTYKGTSNKTGALDAKLTYLTQNAQMNLMEGSQTISITLIPTTVKLTKIEFKDAPASIDQGQSIDMSQYVVYTPSNAAIKTLTWTTDHDYQGTIDANGVLTAKRVTGNVVVTATSVRVPSVSASVTLKITEPTITDFTLSDSELTLHIGDKHNLTVTAFVPSYASATASYAAVDNTVVSVSKNGQITAKKIGDTDVNVTVGSVQKVCKVHVVATPVESIGFAESTASVTKGSALQLNPAILPAQAAIDNPTTYSSDNEAVATVSETGLVSGVSQGEAVITATCDGKSAQITIQVVEPALFAKVTDPATLAEKDTIILATIYGGNGVVAGPRDGKKLSVLTTNVTVTADEAYADDAIRLVLVKLKNKTGFALQPVGSSNVLAESGNDLYEEKTTSTKNLTWEFVADENKGIYVHNLGNTNAYFKYHAGNAAIKPYKAGTVGAEYVYVYVRKYIEPVISAVDTVGAEIRAQKIIRDGQLLIIRGGETYSVTGEKR